MTMEFPALPPTVRLAVPHDERPLLELCRLVHAENGIFPLCEAKVQQELQSSIRQDNGILGVIGGIGAPVAVAWLIAHQEWYTEAPAITERFVYVHPDHRGGSTHHRDLILWAKAISNSLAPLLIGVMRNHIRGPAKLRLYQRYLGAPVGYFFIHGIDLPDEPVPLPLAG